MTDTTTLWAVSSIGYGKGATTAEAVAHHDEAVQRDMGKYLSGSVAETPLVVYAAPEGASGFALSTRLYWTGPDLNVEAETDQIRAHRAQPDWWLGIMAERLPAGVEVL